MKTALCLTTIILANIGAKAFQVKKNLSSPDSLRNTLSKVEHQYEQLVQDTWDLVEKEPIIPGSQYLAEKMIEKALKGAALMRYQHEAILDLAEKTRKRAKEDKILAQALESQAHENVAEAQLEVDMLESIDDQYEDLERLRETSRLHASQHLEEDRHEMVVEDAFVELESEAVMEETKNVLDRIQLYEGKLKAIHHQLRDLKRAQRMEEWARITP